ncbi:MAG: diguanylate cyclase [Deltaproteobacteria bacterium]|nr:MAG: diguanylate cyclase [Deltaproteobacteria bacterium]
MTEPVVLVADDELFFRRIFADILKDEGYLLDIVDSGRAAIDYLQQRDVDLVLTDLVMPGIDGLEVLRFARELDNPPDVVLVTGNATLETAVQALKNGARDYLVKPCNPEELKHLVRTCLEQRRLVNENSLLKSQLELFRKGQQLSSQIELDRLLTSTVHALLRELGSGRGFAFLCSETNVEQLIGFAGIEDYHARVLADSLLHQTREARGWVRIGHPPESSPEQLPPDCRQVLIFPLTSQKECKGGLVLVNAPGADLPLSDKLDNLEFLAEQANIGFDNAFRYQGARELIYTDDLTGLYNQRYLDIALNQEIRRADRYGLEFSVLFFDIDHFKTVNDTHGHLSGSRALQEVAGLLRRSIREVDIPFRYGGDEFTALLVETGAEGAAIVAERLRRAIEQHTFLHDLDQDIHLTASIGYATYPGDATSKKQLLQLADNAMYLGKKERNTVRSAQHLNL